MDQEGGKRMAAQNSEMVNWGWGMRGEDRMDTWDSGVAV